MKLASPPTLMAASPFADIPGMFGNSRAQPMMGSPDSGLATDHVMRPILSTDYSSSQVFPSTNTVSMSMSDQLGN